ncbi:hypothetical protein ACLBV5_09810 [Brevundimonas sp. M1A4_2e]
MSGVKTTAEIARAVCDAYAVYERTILDFLKANIDPSRVRHGVSESDLVAMVEARAHVEANPDHYRAVQARCERATVYGRPYSDAKREARAMEFHEEKIRQIVRELIAETKAGDQ